MSRPPTAVNAVQALRKLLGTVPDHEVAAAAGVSVGSVGKFRRSLGIPAYEGYKFQKGHAPLGPAAGGDERPTRRRRSKLEAYEHLVGRMADKEVAQLAGMTPDGVRMYRQRHGIGAGPASPEDEPDGGTASPAPAPDGTSTGATPPALPREGPGSVTRTGSQTAEKEADDGPTYAWQLTVELAGASRKVIVLGRVPSEAVTRAQALGGAAGFDAAAIVGLGRVGEALR